MATICATSQQLRATLGEPADVEVSGTGGTIMRYSLAPEAPSIVKGPLGRR